MRKVIRVAVGMGAMEKHRTKTISTMGEYGGEGLPQLFQKDGLALAHLIPPILHMFPEQNHHLDREYRPNSFVGANLPLGPGAEREISAQGYKVELSKNINYFMRFDNSLPWFCGWLNQKGRYLNTILMFGAK